METNVNYTAVGAFVILLIAALTLGIIWLSSGFKFDQYNSYMVFMEESVTGLSTDSPVEYNGVAVGTVKAIELNHHNPQLVELLLNIEKDTPITRGTTATLATRGLTGITFIALKDDSKDLRPLLAKPGEPFPVIPTAPSIFVRLDTFLSKLSENFDQMAQSFRTLLDDENLQAIKKSLNSLSEVTGNLAANSARLNAIFANTARATQQLTPFLQSSTSAIKMFEAQTLPSTYRLIKNLDTVAESLAEVSTEIKRNPSVIIRGVENPNLGPGETK